MHQLQIHSLELNDFIDEDYLLIGIHTALEDYKLAYLLNKHIATNFIKSSFSLDFENDKNNASFSVFNYTNKNNDFEWFLISNSFKRDKKEISNSLLLATEIKNYLIPEKKNVDFFLKNYMRNGYRFIF